MLTDAQIERWSRQILLPDVGGRGQARLLAARVAMAGGGPDAVHAADLLRRAGVTVAPAVVDADVLVDLDDDRPRSAARTPLVRGRLAGAAGSVTTLVGRPCGLCAPVDPIVAPSTGRILAAPAARVLAALVAAEVLRVLLAPPVAGRRQAFDLLAGTFTGERLAGGGCVACGAQA
jgi:hypothetical protein